MGQAWNAPQAPRHLLASDPLRALLASQSSVRCPHPVRLRCDEIDTMDLDILHAALGQPMSKGGVPAQTVLSSTHQVADGSMSAALKLAAENSWGVAEWCYKETMQPHGWLSPEEVEAKRQDLPAHVFAVEIDLQRPPLDAILPSHAITPGRMPEGPAVFQATHHSPRSTGVVPHVEVSEEFPKTVVQKVRRRP